MVDTITPIDWSPIKSGYTPGNHNDSADPTQGNEEDQLKAAMLNVYEDALQAFEDFINGNGFAIQTVYEQDGSPINVVNSPIPFDNSEPDQSLSEGGQIITATITPKYSDSILLFWASTFGQAYANSRIMTLALFKDAVALAKSASCVRTTTATAATQISLIHKDTASGTVAEVWKLRLGTNTSGGGTDIYVNQDSAPQTKYNGIAATALMIMEVRP
jgi:hypothetical protein